MTSESSPTYKCRYCEKAFRKESSLAVHLCEPKRRWQQEKEVAVQLGLKAYLRFYEITQGSARLKSYADFVASPYYNAFVKWGRHMVAIRGVNPGAFLEWLLKNNKKIDQWCRDEFYVEYLQEQLRREAVQDALERALKEMENYADDHPDLKNGLADYFRYGNSNRICHHIATGRVSPWIIFNCGSGVEFLDTLHEEQIGMIIEWIDPVFWNKRFQDYLADAEWVRDILGKAGL
jgi:hypothetical protein